MVFTSSLRCLGASDTEESSQKVILNFVVVLGFIF